MNNSELKKLAWDIHAGKIFTDRHIRKDDYRLVASIFMPTIFMSEKQRNEVINSGMIYEYYDKAGPRSINGYPCFMSLRILNKDDTKKIIEYVKEIETIKRNFDSQPEE